SSRGNRPPHVRAMSSKVRAPRATASRMSCCANSHVFTGDLRPTRHPHWHIADRRGALRSVEAEVKLLQPRHVDIVLKRDGQLLQWANPLSGWRKDLDLERHGTQRKVGMNPLQSVHE